MPFLLGLTGNIACGKSTVGRLLAERYGADYVDADRLVHELYAPGTPETAAVAARFGNSVLAPNGSVDRSKLGPIVLADPTALKNLQDIVHVGVGASLERRLAASSAKVVVVDAIRLIEAGLAERCAAVWVVVCSRATQVHRLAESRGMDERAAALRIDAQGPQEEKVRHATAVIQNDGSLADVERQVEVAWAASVAPHLTG